jgi:Phospholipase_D-nuclease N-terminal
MTMILATGYPFLEVFWTMLIFFALVALLYLVFIVFADIFRRHDESGWVKVLWILFIILVPWIGVFIYLIIENGHMGERGSEPR